ncbi:DUF4251 domain-containing protein [Flavobacterium sp. ANB]|uniref:DUF4251 domain-containing protein n=1 Tax=unclassified Flavobacterium TaxID=196869 RepID=UPI0012B9A472|nr:MULTISPECIES: DUF4251 domain-containing protein [unclassified Flavobacterium]MBF4518184.1 DUF4251 domain-containing protein [Flavobacterium sp. ANB]MTD72353.1 DUF4251 domain-containing protein [Flavobacterium sp. LC2016-13]
MKKIISILVVLVSFLSFEGFAQEKSKKELKAERELQQQKEIQALLDAKDFVFDAEKLYPQSGRMINLDYNTYFLKFTFENVTCDLPFFGRGFNVGYGSDGGIKFKGKPENIKIEQSKKKYTMKATVQGENDVYDLFFTIFFDGGATLSVNSNNRASISYDGKIRAPKAEESKK